MTARSTLATSLPLRAWLRRDARWRQQPLNWRARQAWLAGLGSLNARLSAAIAGQGAAVELQDPVLIVGPWRSGTTVMHELLTAATGCATPLTWQCMNACAFRLGSPRRKAAPIARPMDGLEIHVDSPQEDEFALLTLGADSAYRAFWMPHRLGELGHTLERSHWMEHPEWLVPWETFLRGVIATADGATAAQPLILKSPNHTYRIGSILQRFPRTRLVWMARDPGQVFMSNRKMWTAMFEAHGITPPLPGALDTFLRQVIDSSARILRWCAETLPADQLVVLPHEALLANPAAAVDATIRRLALPRTGSEATLQAAIARTAAGRVERHGPTWPADLATAVQALEAAHQAAMPRYGIRLP
jgi:hypothetical protein